MVTNERSFALTYFHYKCRSSPYPPLIGPHNPPLCAHESPVHGLERLVYELLRRLREPDAQEAARI